MGALNITGPCHRWYSGAGLLKPFQKMIRILVRLEDPL